ncbi:MAG: FG-GAP repeat protein [Gemmatimonadales bacterium]
MRGCRPALGGLLILGLLVGLVPRAGWADAPGGRAAFVERALLYAANGETDDGFGDTVAVSADGRRVVVGAPQAAFAFSGAGKAYVFVQPAGGWGGQLTETARLRATDARYGDNFGTAVALSEDGRTVVVGASHHFGLAGALYVFEEPAGGWTGIVTQTARLRASDLFYGDYLGATVAISGETIVAGAFGHDVGGNYGQGALYVYVKPPGGWVSGAESAQLVASDGASNDGLGGVVAIAGGRVVGGALSADGGTPFAGAAYVFERPAGGWTGVVTETAKLIAAATHASDNVGSALALAGELIVVGARGDSAVPGAAYVYEAPPGGWGGTLTETARLSPSAGAPDDAFGTAVALAGDNVVVGASHAEVGGQYWQGAAYVFEEPVGGWAGTVSESARLTASAGAPEDRFGGAVALGNHTLVVGADGATSPTYGEGQAYLFVDDAPRAPLLEISYRYYAGSGESGSGIVRLYDDGTFLTDTGATGRWGYLHAQQRFLFQSDPGHFCEAFFLGQRQGSSVRGLYACQDGSEVGGIWFGTLARPLDELPNAPIGDRSLQAPVELLRALEPTP